MKTYTLDVQKRDAEVNANAVRAGRQIPGIFYGKGEQNVPVQMDYQSFRKVYMETGQSQLIDLTIEGAGMKKVLVHDIQLDSLQGTIQHVDFMSVDLKKPIVTEVPINFVGEPPAVKDFGGILNTVKTYLEIKCLPLEIPHDIEIDISGLMEFSDSIHVSEVKVPEGIEIQNSEDEVVVIINAPRKEEEPEPVEGAEGVEGAEAAEGAEGESAEGSEEKAEGGDEGGDEKKEE